MKNVLLLVLMIGFFMACTPEQANETQIADAKARETRRPDYAIAIHGGAGTIRKANMTTEKEKAYLTALNKALDIGESILKDGGTSLDAIVETIKYMEDVPLFNAGKGAVFTNAERNELDASIMDGATQNAGAVGGVSNVRNPITAARAVMDKSAHVMLTGQGAEQFAVEQGLDTVSNDYFYTESRFESLQRIKASENQQTGFLNESEPHKYGTVGCVALDKNGNIAAGTSTGGMTNKRYNRIGDSPIIGAGSYANNATCAISSTGHGEYFIRYVVAHDISAIMEYKGESLEDAADYVINDKLKNVGGSGGIIAVDKNGNIAMPFNTEGMYRGYAKPGERSVKIYKE